ncbi:MAG: hypothetical protein M0P12_00885 [Paludibacteraceae bacterium]|nr:hypothetical protein [Paludibacteraceae bacterium]
MKNIVAGIVGLLAIAALVGGCTLTLAQEKAIAKQLGIASAVTWIGLDNPDQEDVQVAKTVSGYIATACQGVGSNSTYYAEIYPLTEEYIIKSVATNKQPVAKLAAAYLLTGIDTVLAMNPTWKENQDKVTQIASSYCEGFSSGLNMSAIDPVYKAATQQIPVRCAYRHVR